ncbi:MAG: host attachment protein [Paracoccaceae bacterium]|nr:MAG: host attachment protein [Paracoccaceae bacterium]
MQKIETWILVADATSARLFRTRARHEPLQPVPGHALNTEIPPARELEDDRPGRTFDRFGAGRHAKEPRTDPVRVEKQRFAHRVAELLDADRRHNRFERLILVAPPQFLGDLRASLPEETRALVSAEIDKDYTRLDPEELRERLDEALRG